MEKKPPYQLTPFDCLVTNDMLQMLKLLLPYMPVPFQRMAGMYAKFSEFINALYYFQPPYYHSRRGRLRQKEADLQEILKEMSPYMPKEFSESLEGAVQMMQMMEVVSSMEQDGGLDFGSLAGQFLTPEQTEQFQTFQQERTDKHERMDGSSRSEESGPSQTGTDTDGSAPDTGKTGENAGAGHAFSDHRSHETGNPIHE